MPTCPARHMLALLDGEHAVWDNKNYGDDLGTALVDSYRLAAGGSQFPACATPRPGAQRPMGPSQSEPERNTKQKQVAGHPASKYDKRMDCSKEVGGGAFRC